MSIDIEGFCIVWSDQEHPSLEVCTVEKMGDGLSYRRPTYRNGKQVGYEFHDPGVDFFTDRLAGLKELRRLLVARGDECRQVLERVHYDVWRVDDDIRQVTMRGYGTEVKE